MRSHCVIAFSVMNCSVSCKLGIWILLVCKLVILISINGNGGGSLALLVPKKETLCYSFAVESVIYPSSLITILSVQVSYGLMIFCPFRYRLRSKVEIDNVSKEFLCWQRFGHNVEHTGPSTQEPEAQSIGWGQGVDHAAESAAQGNGHGWEWFKDPRLDCLGYRGIFPANTIRKSSVPDVSYCLWHDIQYLARSI